MSTPATLLLVPLLAFGAAAASQTAPAPAPPAAAPDAAAASDADAGGEAAVPAADGEVSTAGPAADEPATDGRKRKTDRRGDELQEPEIARPQPAALQLGAFNSMRAARLSAAGELDTGAGVLTLLDEATGTVLAPQELFYVKSLGGTGPELWVDWTARLGEVEVAIRALAIASSRNGDERIKSVLHLTLLNATDAPQVAKLGARLLPGDGDPQWRPLPSLPFAPGLRYALDGTLLTRDGAALLTWIGAAPEVEIPPAPVTPADPGALLHWTLDVPPQSARYLDLFVAGPNASGSVDESAWRDGFAKWTYAQVEETLGWQSQGRGYFADFQSTSTPLRRAMVAAVHQLRLLGDADREFRQFSDRPYGHPATDDAFQAECIGLMAEWGWVESELALLREFVASAAERGAALDPDRRVALVHGLARAVRLGSETVLYEQLAAAIRALLTEPAAVEPWLDPAVVRLDLQGILDRGGPGADPGGADYALPELAWAPTPASPVEARMQDVRRRLSARDVEGAWAACREVLDHSTTNGMGWTGPRAELDGRYNLGIMALVRAMFFDDHGDDLHLFPGIPRDLVPARGQLALTTLPTQFGLVETEWHYVGAAQKIVSSSVAMRPARPFGRLLIHVPAGLRPIDARGAIGGKAELLEDGTVLGELDPFNPKGLRFNVRLEKD